MKQRVFLANLGHRDTNLPSHTPPLGLLALAAWIRDRFPLEIQVMDQRAENCPNNEVVRRAAAFEPHFAGFRAVTPDAHFLTDITHKVRQALPHATILAGGPHASAFGARVIEQTAADIAVIGEGERTFEQILSCYQDRRDLRAIPGLVWREPGGEAVVNPGSTPLIENLDSLPFPAYDLLSMEPYFRLMPAAQVPPRRYIPMMTSRGCPHSCIYCHRIYGKKFRAQSAARIVDDIARIQHDFGIDEVEPLDDIFNQDPERVLDFCRLVRQKGIKVRIAFPNGLRTDTLTQEIVDALVDAGMYYTACALESGSPRIQKLMRKHLNIPNFLEGVAMLARRGVYTHGFTMLGFPTETEEDLQQTLDVTCASRLHTATFMTVTPYPNTELYETVRKTQPEKLEKLRYDDTTFTGLMLNLSAVPDKVLYAYQRRAWRRFYFNPTRMFRIFRGYPDRFYILHYIPMFFFRVTKGLFARTP